MPYLARKIGRAKWERKNGLASDEVPADVTADLRTDSNALSLWQLEVPSDNDDLCKIALALATGAQRIDVMDLAWIDKDTVSAQGISIARSDGRAPIKSLRSVCAARRPRGPTTRRETLPRQRPRAP